MVDSVYGIAKSRQALTGLRKENRDQAGMFSQLASRFTIWGSGGGPKRASNLLKQTDLRFNYRGWVRSQNEGGRRWDYGIAYKYTKGPIQFICA
jgi:hypothetical protein